MAAYVPRALLATTTPGSSTAVTVAQGPLSGGFITNPAAATLFVDLTKAAGVAQTGTTVGLATGQTFYIPPLNGNVSVSVNAAAAQAIVGEVW
jgi:hypothetical protein